MRADVLIGEHLAAGAEDADFELIQGKDPVIAIGDIGQFADRDFVHRLAPSLPLSLDSRRAMKPDRHVEHVEVGGANHAAGGDYRFGRRHRTAA